MSNEWDTSQYNRNPSIPYRTAVKALQTLLGSEDENAVERALAEVVSQQRYTDTTHIPMTNSQSYDTGRRKGYHQGWKDALDIMDTMINRYDIPYSRAENGCLEYWRGPLLQWMRGDTRSEVPPELRISSILSSSIEDEEE